MRNIAKVCDPTLTVNKYYAINAKSQWELKYIKTAEWFNKLDLEDVGKRS